MQFSDSAGKTGLIEDITFLLGVNTNNYAVKDRTRNMNARLGLIWHMIFEAYGGWKFMDDNQSNITTGVPYTDLNIASGTGLIALPSAALTIDLIEMITVAAGTFQKLRPLTYDEFVAMGGNGRWPSTGVPEFYMPQGDVIRLLPIPNFTLASALRVHFDAAMTAFVYTDTVAVPGFASIFHRMLSIGAALDYALSHHQTDKAAYLTNLWNDYEHRLKQFYAKRFKERFPGQITTGEDLVEEYS